ncbi:AimR family lysis-lysogeny pheromone receptor [Bacillus sp. FSL W7-1360]
MQENVVRKGHLLAGMPDDHVEKLFLEEHSFGKAESVLQLYRERWRENFVQYRKGMVPEQISVETKDYLQQMGLWEKEDAWTNQVMRDLALSRDEQGHPVLSFEQVMLAVRTFASDRLILLINEYSLALQTAEHIRDAFEYAVQYRQIDLLEQLIKWGEDRDSLKEWARVYQLLLDVMKENITHEETIDQARDLVGHVTDPLLKVRLELLEVATYLKLGYHTKAAYLGKKVPKKLAQVEECFAKKVAESRAGFQIAYDLLYNQGKSEEAERHVAQSVINGATPEVMLAYCYHLLSHATLLRPNSSDSNMSDPSPLSMQYIQRAVFYAEEMGLEDYSGSLQEQDLPFVWNVNGERFDIEGVNPREQVHQYIVRNEHEKALWLIEELERAGNTNAFLIFYRGKATGSTSLLAQAMRRFAQEGLMNLLPLVEREVQKIDKSQFKGEV